MIERLPESWIPPDHILDLRARVGSVTSWVSSARSGSSGSRRCSITTAVRTGAGVADGDGREWLGSQPLPQTAREQIAVALAMIDALAVQIAPLEKELRALCAPSGRVQGVDGPLRDRGADRGHDPRRAG